MKDTKLTKGSTFPVVTTLFLLIFTCKSSGLIVEVQAKPYRESSRVFARASEVLSEIGEVLYPYLSL
jgi:hypothetical protein